MTQNTAKIFGIYKVRTTRILKDLKQVFLEKGYNEAKLYFEGYLVGEQKYQDWFLYQIGEIDERGKLYENKKFITGGYEMKYIHKKDINQLKLDIQKDLEAEKEKTQKDIITKLFEGKII